MKKIVSLILCLASLGVFAQQEASNWYFGENAGIRFDSAAGTVTAVNDGQLNTFEGCASISDGDGNLLFYTSGQIVYNRNHSIMLNGTGLLGDSSSTQSAIIVAKPNDPDIYYIFTVDTPATDGNDEGLNYYEVDMTLDGGLGAVTGRIQLLQNCSEKVSAVLKDCITKSLWVIAYADQNGIANTNDTYYAYEITDTGVNITPVTSNFATVVNDIRGYLKFSPDGTKMVSANMTSGLYLYDFDVATGIVSNELELFINGPNDKSYGVEFSPSNQFLYVHSSNDASATSDASNHSSTLTQFDITAADIQASEFALDDRQLYRSGLQLGPDGRIYRALCANYVTGLPFLGVIANPNELGVAANYLHNAISLGGRNSFQGLPPFDQSLFNSKIDIIQNGSSITNLDLCTGDSYTLIAEDIPGATYIWTLDGIPLPETDFDLFVDQPGQYEVLIDPNNGDCAIEGEAFVTYFGFPVANQPNDMLICDDDNDGIWEFDFTTQNADVLNGQDNTLFEVLYFESQTDADTNTNPITTPYFNTANPQTMYVRAQNIGNPNCSDTTDFLIQIFNTPTANPIDNIVACDDNLDGDATNGQREFDLSDQTNTILGSQSAADYSVTYHSSQADADANMNPLANPYYNLVSPETIFARIENNDNANCIDTTSFTISVDPIPTANNVSLFQCDEDGIPEGFTIFNLTEANDAITGADANLATAFFLTFADAQSGVNPIDGTNFSNFLNPQIIYVQVTDNTTNCFGIAELSLEVSATSINDAQLTTCDDDGSEDGFFNFNLSNADADVLTGAPAGVTLVYHETYEEALLEQNPLGNNYTNTTPYSQIIYARAENANACYGISEVLLSIYELPDIALEDEMLYCLNFFPETIVISGGVINDSPSNYYYLWSTGDDSSEIEVNNPGTYSVRVTNTNGCYKDRTVTVRASNIATITDIQIVDASENNTISVIVSGEGDYEYALNNALGPYQDESIFENVQPGFHTVYVRDKNGCGVIDEMVSVIGFPRYFTPNSDGYHDTWQVKGITGQFQSHTKIYIYNQYGKLLTQIDPFGAGWDGNHKGKPLPTNDYWFAVTLQDGRVYKNHFTLKR